MILFRRLLDFVGICSRVLVAIHYRKFFIDSKFNIKYFEGNEKSLGKRGPAGRKTGAGLSGRGQSNAKKNFGKASGKGALKNIAQKVSMAFAEKIEESLQSESEVEVGGLGASRRITESQMMSAEDPTNVTLELDSRVEDAFAGNSLQPKDPKRPKIPFGNPKAKRAPVNIGISMTMSQTKGAPAEKLIPKSQDGLSQMIIEEENPMLSLKIADFDQDFDLLQKKMRALRSAYKTGNITKNPTPNDYQLMKESFLWVEVWDVLALEWVHVNALSGQVHRNFQTSDALKTKISNNRVMLVMALRLAEVDEGKSLNRDDVQQNPNNNIPYYDSIPDNLQPSVTSRHTHKLFIKNVSTKYLPERWTKLNSAHARYRITSLTKKLFSSLPISSPLDLSSPEFLTEFSEDLSIDTAELQYKPIDYENLRNHSFYTSQSLLKPNQALAPSTKPVSRDYKFREKWIYYKHDILNLYSPFALSLLGLTPKHGQVPREPFDGQGAKGKW